jgi:hypothetical protein
MMDVRLRVRRPEPDEHVRPFVDLLFERVGPRRGARLMSYIQAWGVAADELDRAPTAEEYAARFQLPIATAYRDQALFRTTFREETPARLLDALWEAARGARMRHIMSAPVVLALDGPADASPAIAWFVATVIDRLPPGAAGHVDRVVPPLAGSAADRRTEVARAYRLAERAVFSWSGAALVRAGEEGRAMGLASLERFGPFDVGAATYAAGMLREYVDGGLDEQAAETCLAAADAAEATAELRVRARAGDADEFARVGRAAATALTAAFAAAAIGDVVTPTAGTVDELLAAPRSQAV